jgi:hypothetical protein
MNVRAKFTVTGIRLTKDWRQGAKEDAVLHTIEMSPVVSDGNENSRFFASTPSGKIELSCIDPAASVFELGKEYYVDFSLAPAES